MTMIGMATRPSDGADPRRTQKRVAVSFSGRQVLVDISGDDRLRLINQLPGRWPEVMKRRESGESLEQIARWAKVPPPCRPRCHFRRDKVDPFDKNSVTDMVHDGPECLSFLVSFIYSKLETDLHEIARNRGRLMI
jgi:hypothetical protein